MTTQERIRTPGWIWPAVAVLLLAQAVVLALWPDAHVLMIDLQVYRAGAEYLLAGLPLYDGGVLLDLPFVYPPFAAVAFVPLTVLPLPVLKFAWTAAGMALGLVSTARASGAPASANRRISRRLRPRKKSTLNDRRSSTCPPGSGVGAASRFSTRTAPA